MSDSMKKKDYLKRYLSKDKKEKKRKKSVKGIVRVKIIDDNLDVHENIQTIQDIKNEDEDAPQVVAVYDERPIELRLHQFKERTSSNWTTIDLEPETTDTTIKAEAHSDQANNDNSPPRRVLQQAPDADADVSPPRRHQRSRSRTPPRKSRWAQKTSKTLDGKTAGLQNAKDLAVETASFKQREAQHFAEMAPDISGVHSATVMRDRKTGKIRNLEAEAVAKSEEGKKKKQLQEKYEQWGKGVKQVAQQQEKLEQDVYEMSKPLARYADDADLEKHLREQERAGDPMLAYFRKKKRAEAVSSGIPLKARYEGEFMPNRYAIRPGHRWDGVDRSNGYEKKWFDAISDRNAQREEAYRWNSEDM